jgi:hypothetical protein
VGTKGSSYLKKSCFDEKSVAMMASQGGAL